jgi:two-component system OmpR family response regulator
LLPVVAEGNFRREWNPLPGWWQCPHLPMQTITRHILLVDPDRDARTALAGHLEAAGFHVTAAAHGSGMTRALERTRIDLVLLDVSGAARDGLEECRRLRANSDVPCILLSRRVDDLDRILGLELGADDYLAKSVNPRELVARLRNLLRRALGAGAATARARHYRFAGWQLDSVARELRDSEQRLVPLRNSEFRVLATLLAHGNRVVSRLKLVELARGRDGGPFDRSIDVCISRLRHVLRDDARGSRIIKTVHGEGYVIGVAVERL